MRAGGCHSSEPLLLASGVLLAMAAFPGLPKIPFLLLSGGLGATGWGMRRKGAAEEQVRAAPPPPQRENLDSLLKVEPLAVEVGLGLVKLVEGGQTSPLLKRIAGIRRQLASELGYILPPVRVTDNLGLRAREYLIAVKGVEVARFELNRQNFPGVNIVATLTRHYPLGETAAHLVGYVGGVTEKELEKLDPSRYQGISYIGKTGVEASYESVLHGQPGYKVTEANAAGRLLRQIEYKPPKPLRVPRPPLPSSVAAVVYSKTRVQVKVRIDAKGNVVSAEPIAVDAKSRLNAEVVVRAARYWRFEPAQRDGVPSADELVVNVDYEAGGK